MGLKKSYKRRKRRGQSGSHRLKTGRTGSVHHKRMQAMRIERKKRTPIVPPTNAEIRRMRELMTEFFRGLRRRVKPMPQMFDSVREAFAAAKKKAG